MRIYIAHSKDINYIEDLYKPLRNDSFFKNHELILPHETDINSANTREFYKTIDVFIADCTEPATGLGIEIGWAYDDNKKIYCIYKSGSKISSSIKVVTDIYYEYSTPDEVVSIVKNIVEENNKETC